MKTRACFQMLWMVTSLYLLRGKMDESQLGFMYFKNEQQCFIGFKNTRQSLMFLEPIKYVLQVFLTASKPMPLKRFR